MQGRLACLVMDNIVKLYLNADILVSIATVTSR